MTDNAVHIEKLEHTMLGLASAGGLLTERIPFLPEETEPCSFERLSAEAASALEMAPDTGVRILLVGLIASGCMIAVGIEKPQAPPTPEGAWQVFSDWGNMPDRCMRDLRNVYQNAADMAAEMYVMIEMIVEGMRIVDAQGDSDAR